MENIIVAVVSGLCTAVPSIIAVVSSNKKNQAVTDYKIDELTREVRIHNNFAQRVPVLEEKVKNLEKAK